ncbi:putative multiple myeloma tumor-associated protein 2 like protein [Cricetulus griseus]|nr:putative multiple myeloma tumor-associated protein 2 like protein [Cricetulus griseus]
MFGSSRGGVRGGQDQFNWEDVKTDKQRENYLGNSLMAPDFVEICKREGGDPEDKGVDRLLGLGSASGSAGRVALSREDKEAAKLGLSVFTHHRVDSEGPSTTPSAARKKPRAEDKAELDTESHKKSKKEKKKKRKKHKKHKKKKDKEHKRETDSCPSSPSPRPRHQRHDSDFSPCCKRKRGHSQDNGRSPPRRRQDRGSDD